MAGGLAAAAGAYLGFGGTLADSFSIPGTETDRVTKQLSQEISGRQRRDGARRVPDRRRLALHRPAEVSRSATRSSRSPSIDDVSSVLNPFESAQQREAQAQQLADGADQVAAGARAARRDRRAARRLPGQLEASQEQLDAAMAEAKAAGTYDAAADQFAAQQQQIDEGLAQVADGRAQVEQGRAELDTQETQLDLGQQARRLCLRTAHRVARRLDRSRAPSPSPSSGLSLSQATKDAVVETMSSAPIDGVDVELLRGPRHRRRRHSRRRRDRRRGHCPDRAHGDDARGPARAAADRDVGRRRGRRPCDGPRVLGRGRHAVRDPRAGRHARPGRRNRLLAVHRQPPPHPVAHGHGPLHESVGLATGTSGNAVVFAGSTVLVALLALNVTGVPFLGVMGSVAAFAVAVAVRQRPHPHSGDPGADWPARLSTSVSAPPSARHTTPRAGQADAHPQRHPRLRGRHRRLAGARHPRHVDAPGPSGRHPGAGGLDAVPRVLRDRGQLWRGPQRDDAGHGRPAASRWPRTRCSRRRRGSPASSCLTTTSPRWPPSPSRTTAASWPSR